MHERRGQRLDPAVFELPVERIRSGWFTDAYFNRSKEVLEASEDETAVTMQVFQKRDAVLAGIDEAVAVLKLCSGRTDDAGGWIEGWDQLEVEALCEGDPISPGEPVMHISGPYAIFAHLETVYLGCLARGTLVATNVRRVVEAAAGKDVLFFPARHDRYANQAGDGWAAHVGGAFAVSTDAQGSWYGAMGAGTVPHALIATMEGDTVAAARAFAERYAAESNVIVLVDFDNDSVGTSLAVADTLGDKLWGVRLDTAGDIVDRALEGLERDPPPTGVTTELVALVRQALDGAGHTNVRIVVSGGFDVERIAAFERAAAPVDAYGVGSSLRRGSNDFTADVVLREGEPGGKVGRELTPSERLLRVQ